MNTAGTSRTPYTVTSVGVVWLREGSGGGRRQLEFPVAGANEEGQTQGWRAAAQARVHHEAPFRLGAVDFISTDGASTRVAVELPSGPQRRLRADEARDWSPWLDEALRRTKIPEARVRSCSVVETSAEVPTLLISPVRLETPVWGPPPKLAACRGSARAQLSDASSRGTSNPALSAPAAHPQHSSSPSPSGAALVTDEIDPDQIGVDTVPIPTLRQHLSRRLNPRGRLTCSAMRGSRTRPRKGAFLVSGGVTLALALGMLSVHGLMLRGSSESTEEGVSSASELVLTSEAAADSAPVGSAVPVSEREKCPSLEEAAAQVQRLLAARGEAMEIAGARNLLKIQGWDLTVLDAADLVRRREEGAPFISPDYRVEVNSLVCTRDEGRLNLTLVATVGGISAANLQMRAAAVRMELRGSPLRIYHIRPL